MPKVYAVQQVMKWNPNSKQLEVAHDLTPARPFGDIEFLIENGKSPIAGPILCRELKRKLIDFVKGDHILAVGDPVAIGTAIAIASKNTGGSVDVLKWDRETRSYISVHLEI